MGQSIALSKNEKGHLVLKQPDAEVVQDVRIRRVFPLTHPDRFISVRSSEGKELLLLDSLEGLPAEQRQLIDESLNRTTFVPRIVRVDDVDVRFGYQQWKVQTDRGPADFRVQEREDIRFLNDGKFRIKDADGNVYEMDSLDKLDDASRRAVEPLM
jgi:hypothetical protein